MGKLMSVAAFAASALMALPAMAADLHEANGVSGVVRISSFDKSRTQILREIDAAAIKVCANASGVTCLGQSRYEGERQLDALTRRKRLASGRIDVARWAPSAARTVVAQNAGGGDKQHLAQSGRMALALNESP